MPAKSKAQFRLMKAAENSPEASKRLGISQSTAAEYTASNEGRKAYRKLPEHMKKGGVSLAVGRGEKMPVSRGAGLTAKGRAKYNRETGSNLKAPQPQGGRAEIRFAREWGRLHGKVSAGAGPERR